MQIGSSTSSLAQMLQQLQQQMQQKVQQNFTTADSDGDGQLSQTEFEAFDQAMRAGAQQGTQSAQGTQGSSATSQADALFKKLDTNGDGQVSMAELQTGMQKMHQHPPMSNDTLSTLLQTQESGSGDGSSSAAGSQFSDLLSMLDGSSNSDGSSTTQANTLLQQMLASYNANNANNSSGSVLSSLISGGLAAL